MAALLKLDYFIVCHMRRAPRFVLRWAWFFSRLGDGWLWGGLGAYLLLANDLEAFKVAAVAVILGVSLFGVLKFSCGRIRPTGAKFSFPSGHSLTAFAMFGSVAPYHPHLALWCALPCALMIALSRVILRVHYLSDVVAGSLLGTFIALVAHRAVR